jgi:hypothetical protein
MDITRRLRRLLLRIAGRLLAVMGRWGTPVRLAKTGVCRMIIIKGWGYAGGGRERSYVGVSVDEGLGYPCIPLATFGYVFVVAALAFFLYLFSDTMNGISLPNI